jgi:hypothetical protein
VTGILRIAYEQLEGRSHLSTSIPVAIVLGVITLGLACSMAMFQEPIRSNILKACGASGLLFVGFSVGALSSRKDAKLAAAQEKAIAEMTVAALTAVTSAPGFKPGNLDSLQQGTLKKVVAKTKANVSQLSQLLQG